MPLFSQYVGIDYSGAETPTSSLSGLRVYVGRRGSAPVEQPPPDGLKRYWTRRGIAEWLVDVLRRDEVTLVGIDHACSFPLEYFQKYQLPLDWPAFLEDFCRHWPTDGDNTYVDFVRDGSIGEGASRCGDTRWRRLVETWTGAKSAFHFEVQGQVAKATHAGLPWLRFLRQQCGDRLFFWPFDGWELPPRRSAIVEVYPALWNTLHPAEGRTADQHDAFSVAEWMTQADDGGRLSGFFNPPLRAEDRQRATIEGWILGVMEDQRSSRARRTSREEAGANTGRAGSPSRADRPSRFGEGGVFVIQADERLVELTEAPYDSEDLLQGLLARYPDLLAGKQMDPESPRRWLLVAREAGVPDGPTAGARWSVDHLFLDQDGIPTLVEVKRSTDSRIRREVVGQMLDYAANGVVYWPVESLRDLFAADCGRRGLDPDRVLGDFLATDETEETFWGRVKTNLLAGRVRMVFVADEIPAELRRIVEFLNAQLEAAEVLAVEIRQYVGEGLKTLVPRVIGRTEAATTAKSTGGGLARQWDEPSFFEELTKRHGREVADVARDILAWGRSAGLDVWWGRGKRDGSFLLWREKGSDASRQWFVSCWTYGRFEIPFEYMSRQGAFASASLREELRRRFNTVQGLALPEEAVDRRPATPLAALVTGEARRQFLAVLGWMLEQGNRTEV